MIADDVSGLVLEAFPPTLDRQPDSSGGLLSIKKSTRFWYPVFVFPYITYESDLRITEGLV